MRFNGEVSAITVATATPNFKHLGVMTTALLLIALLTGCAIKRGMGDGGISQDAEITANVRDVLGQHPELGPPNDIQVTTHRRVVYLSGLVATPLQSESASSLGQEIPGVAAVVSNVAVEQ